MSLKVRHHRFNPLPALLVLAAGGVLLALTAAGLAARSIALPALQFIGAAATDAATTSAAARDAGRAAAVGTLERALRFAGRDHTLRKQLAGLHLATYQAHLARGDEAAAALSLAAGRDHLLATLAAAPGDANAWYLLAEIAAGRGELDRSTLDFLTLSYLTGPREGWVSLRRLTFALRYWLLLDPSLQQQARREIRTLWQDAALRPQFVRYFAAGSKREQGVILMQMRELGEPARADFLRLARRYGWQGETSPAAD